MAEKDATVRLRRAVQENNLFLVKRLIKRTGDMRNPDPTHKRFTSLAWAAILGNEETNMRVAGLKKRREKTERHGMSGFLSTAERWSGSRAWLRLYQPDGRTK
ncbi:hypothetical protein BDY19DRAFT_138828 [Irpex rosettiformis]|uniref:Uncharacterized protein n=1 Tax=Irpex rosettiformis TaxID=378272 RepID=A0ACB8U520_9APHY|nr:hypothetical protein BDY19DRAFT_138828 [Irpex rosettiformis]